MRSLKWQKSQSKSHNLHVQTGAVLSLVIVFEAVTGSLVAVPQVMSLFMPGHADDTHEIDGPPPAPSLAAPQLDVERVFESASPHLSGVTVESLFTPTETNPMWVINAETETGPLRIGVDDRSGEASASRPPPPDIARRTLMTMLGLHGGRYGIVAESLIFISGVVLSLLSITGILMWLQGRSRRKRRQARA